MSEVFVLSEDVELSAKLIALAKGLSGSISVVTIDQEHAKLLSRFPVDQVYEFRGVSRLSDCANDLADLLQAKSPSLLLVGDTINGREVAAMTAAHIDSGLVSGAIAIEQIGDHFETTRMLYGGALLKTEILSEFTVVTLSGGKFEAPEPGTENAPITPIDVKSDAQVKLIKVTEITREGVDLNSADVIIGVGLGFDKKEDLKLAEELAEVCHGVVGCTRPVSEDKKWLPAGRYIGISGENIKPALYIAVGISGQIQHTVGIRDAETIVAINSNKNAPIFKAADYGVVGDLYEILPHLTKALERSS